MNKNANEGETKSMKLFNTSPGKGWNAELASNRSPRALASYARGYFRASRALLHPGSDDLLFHPAVFAFRHGVELSLKSLARDFHVVGESEALGRPNHPLGEIWAKVREPVEFYHSEFYFEPEGTLSPADLDAVIYELDRTDERSMAFRYPCALDGAPYLEGLSLVDMGQFARVAERVSCGLMVWVDWVSERAEARTLSDWHKG